MRPWGTFQSKTRMHPIAQITARVFVVTALLFVCCGVWAQEPSSPAAAPPLARADIETRAARIQENAALDEALKGRIAELYRQALADVDAAADWRAKADEWTASRDSAPERIRELEDSLRSASAPSATLEEWADRPMADLVQAAGTAEEQLAQARRDLAAIEAESSGRVERRRQLPELIARARERLALAQMAPAPRPELAPEESEATRLTNRARVEVLEAEIAAYNAESSSYEARGRLLPLRQDRADLDVRVAEQRSRQLQDILASQRQAEAEQAAEDARALLLEALDAPPAVRALAEELAQQNEDDAAMRTGPSGMLRRIEDTKLAIARIEAKTAETRAAQENVIKREKAVGLNDAVGRLLRTYRANLPARRLHTVEIRLREETIGDAQIAQIELEDRRRELSDIPRRIEDTLKVAGFAADTNSRQEEELSRLLTELFSKQRDNLDDLWADYDAYITALVELNDKQKTFVDVRDEFADYIDERVLWIRSGTFISAVDFREGIDALVWLVSYGTWSDAVSALAEDVERHPMVYIVALTLAGVALLLWPRIRTRLAHIGEKAQKRACINYGLTIEALLYTLLLGALVPAIIAFIAWRMRVSLVGGEFVQVLSSGLFIVALFYASVEFPRQVLRVNGLATSHFDWPDEAAKFAKNTIGWMMPVALPIILLIALFESQEQQEWRESVGRLAFFIMMVVWAYLGHRFSNRHSAALSMFEVIALARERSRVRRVLYTLSAGAPMVLAAAAALGYYYTSVRVAWRIHATLTVLFLVAVSVNLAMRALLIARRRLAIEQARRKRDELKAAQRKAKDEGGEPVAALETQEAEFDLTRIDAQTSRLIRSVGVAGLFVALWFTWAAFLPALRALDDVVLVHYGDRLDNLATLTGTTAVLDGGGEAAPAGEAASVLREKALTLGDLLFSLLAIVLTIVAFRNLPGLLEIAVLQRLPLAPGERYAIKTVLGYLLAVVGVIIALSGLGIQWGSVQWLVAALGFGIGFGLQEIIANFISGLIILFEQPIRVGDTVTIGEVSGTVTRIRIRATTITDWDLKELVVPNKEFVTGRLVNWSLTNPTLRVIIKVGVAYGSDTKLTRDTLLSVAERNKRVLRQPPPQVYFVSFDDSALMFEARAYIASIEDLLPVRDELHHAIAAAFREKGIEIAFPQQDIHIRSIEAPLTVQGDVLPAELERQ